MKRITTITVSFLAILCMSSCNDFLDTLPDNRTEIDSVEKLQKLLVTGYSSRTFSRYFEYASDNVELFTENNTNTNILIDQNYNWEAITEADNESNVNIWQNYYQMIATANAALQAIEKMGTPAETLPYKGEALCCRAYAHLCLTMIYCLPYDPSKASGYLGVTYMDKPETTLNPKYTRGDLQTTYEKIRKDIEEALPLMNDDAYEVPAYHFNRSAAYALATRFYIYSGQWEKAVETANAVLGSDPAEKLRDWKATSTLEWGNNAREMNYINHTHKCNLLLIPIFSANASLFHPWNASGKRYTHTARIAKQETIRAKRPMGGPYDTGKNDSYNKLYHCIPYIWEDLMTNSAYFPKWPRQWEVVNPVAGTGYNRTTAVALSTNEVLLNRAEAYIHLKDYDKAAKDMDLWSCSVYKVGENGIQHLTRSLIEEVYGNPESDRYIEEYTRELPTSRKPLHPQGFTVDQGTQEYFFQALLYCRRIETLGEGLRWIDIKRFGITIDRFDDTNYVNELNTGYKATVTLPYNDLRRAFQIPAESIKVGLEANPRNNQESPSHPFVNQ